MFRILMTSPLIQLYLFYVAALLILCLWPTASYPSERRCGCGETSGLPRTGAGDPSPLTHRFPGGARKSSELPAYWNLAAACSREYSARFSPRIKQIRKW
jgi:hypothetical protein